MKTTRVGLLFGGRSAEHEISLLSARSIRAGLLEAGFEVVPLAVTREGRWLPPDASEVALEGRAVEDGAGQALHLCPGEGSGSARLLREGGATAPIELDVIFPVLHGTYGEDGTVQGLLELLGIPYVGCGVAGASVGMDKILMKALWAAAGLPVLPAASLLRSEIEADPEAAAARCLVHPGLPCFVKPANLGSSVGIRRAGDPEALRAALLHAAEYDRRVLVERAVERPREIEVGVIGDDLPEASVPGEVVHAGPSFYDYQTKYWGDVNPAPRIPAPLEPAQAERVRELARQAWRALDLSGLSRVDFLVDEGGGIWLNEVNTMPGFTALSMFPKLWAASGVPYPELLRRLVSLAQARFADRQRNKVRPAQA